jgi:hypothetical protein
MFVDFRYMQVSHKHVRCNMHIQCKCASVLQKKIWTEEFVDIRYLLIFSSLVSSIMG